MHIQVSIADIFARFKRLQNYNVLFLTGTDEHARKFKKKQKKIIKTQNNFAMNYLKTLDH